MLLTDRTRFVTRERLQPGRTMYENKESDFSPC